MATKSSKKGTKAASSKKGAKKRDAAARPAEGTMLGRVDLIVAPPPPTQLTNIQIQPIPGPDSEDAIKCRTRSTLSLFPGIFKDFRTDNDPTDGRVRFTFVLNDNHAIYFFVPNCPNALKKSSEKSLGASGCRFETLQRPKTSGPSMSTNRKPTLMTAVTFCVRAAQRVPTTLTQVRDKTAATVTAA